MDVMRWLSIVATKRIVLYAFTRLIPKNSTPPLSMLQFHRLGDIRATVVGLVGEVNDDLLHDIDAAQKDAFVQPLVALVPEIRCVVHRGKADAWRVVSAEDPAVLSGQHGLEH